MLVLMLQVLYEPAVDGNWSFRERWWRYHPCIMCIVVSFDPGIVASQAMELSVRIFIFSLVLVFVGGWFSVLSSLKFFLRPFVPQ